MNLDEIRRILELVHEHALAEFELEGEGFKIRIRKDTAAGDRTAAQVSPGMDGQPGENAATGVTEAVLAAQPIANQLTIVKSPIVGTFYRSPEPGAPAFVELGQVVRRGQVLCIIEAMKLMNEIESEYDGEVVSIYVENGQAVQYGERLFGIQPSGNGS